MKVSSTLHYKGSKKNIAIIVKKELKNKAWLLSEGLNFLLNWTNKK